MRLHIREWLENLRATGGNRPKLHCPMVEAIETRTLMSVVPAIDHHPHGPSPNTVISLKVESGAIGQAITFTATVRDDAALGPPTGEVRFKEGAITVGSAWLWSAGGNKKFDYSTATYTIAAGADGAASFLSEGQYGYYLDVVTSTTIFGQTGSPDAFIGRHPLSAIFSGDAPLKASRTSTQFRISMPKFTNYPDGLKVATVEAGSGGALATGDIANIFYTGYVYKTGSIFDDSENENSPYQFTVESSPEQVIPGVDEATVGMEIGETRVVVVPPALGYGSRGESKSVPSNAELVFVITRTWGKPSYIPVLYPTG